MTSPVLPSAPHAHPRAEHLGHHVDDVVVAAVERSRTILADASLLGSVIVFHIADHHVLPDQYQLAAHVVVGVSAPLAAAALGATVEELGLAPAALGSGLRAGLLSGSLSAAVVLGAAYVPALEPLLTDPRAETASRGAIVRKLAVEIPIGTAVYEELVFRSALLALAERRLPRRSAVALTSVLFGLWHVLPALDDRRHNPVAQQYPFVATVLPTVAATTVAGVLFTRLRRRAGHVIAPIVSHAMFNSAAFVASQLAHRRAARRQ